MCNAISNAIQVIFKISYINFKLNILIKNRASATAFIDALENAEGKKRKKVQFDKSVETVKDKEQIKKIFGK